MPGVVQRAKFLSGYVYGSSTFDPRYIVLQILVIQIAFYGLFSTALILAAAVSRTPIGVSVLVDPSRVVYSTLEGRIIAIATLLTSVILGVFVSWVVERSRKCLDFCVTVFFLHGLAVCLISQFPLTLAWWILQGLACVSTILVSERLCRHKESEELRFALPTTDAESVGSVGVIAPPVVHTDGDTVEMVFGRPNTIRVMANVEEV
eukprot:Gregarina_sp_Poly_1__9715@NODE_617_length_7122_cov_220_571368_g473_i0_p3_GENE_NODE_617_length_7122_cov_220_571368_g473_i0NODE_617_length_7122_cov_220_571368_g473_i0_p3_ORF_typecomplete_len206_score22_73SYS1/PF09801_9/2_2e32DUF4491/PF14898_6/4e03DUF4491/PF14898_6/0_011DUF4381/PF14316_6/7_3e02DUF4381/PF14316_6/0_96TMEM138/PF14935_6/1_1e03TMEM138/PF14935_6/0_31_NODE_617_length_7122_cov_220_571368_g473_i036694286